MRYFILNTPVIYGSENGYVHLLQLSSLSSDALDGNEPEWAGHLGNNTIVTNVWKSRVLDFGSNNLLKSLRSTKIQMSGEEITIVLTYTGADGQIDTDTFSDISLPLNNHSFFEINNDNRIFRNVQIKITGNNLELRQITFLYRQKRFK